MDDTTHAVAWRDATELGPLAQAELLAELLDADDSYADSTARRLGTTLIGLGRRLQALGVDDLASLDPRQAAAFVHAVTRRGNPPAIATQHLRRTTVRVAVRQLAQLGVAIADPTASLQLPAKDGPTGRPLLPDELTLLRVTAASRSRRRGAALATVALCEAGATTGEAARLRWPAVDLATGRVDLPGAGPTRPRTIELTSWGHRAITNHHTTSSPDPDGLVVYRGTADPESDTAQAAVTTRLRRLLDVAGLDDPGLRPGSVRLCMPARQLTTDGRIDLAARRLGIASLDIAARQLHWHWDT